MYVKTTFFWFEMSGVKYLTNKENANEKRMLSEFPDLSILSPPTQAKNNRFVLNIDLTKLFFFQSCFWDESSKTCVTAEAQDPYRFCGQYNMTTCQIFGKNQQKKTILEN